MSSRSSVAGKESQSQQQPAAAKPKRADPNDEWATNPYKPTDPKFLDFEAQQMRGQREQLKGRYSGNVKLRRADYLIGQKSMDVDRWATRSMSPGPAAQASVPKGLAKAPPPPKSTVQFTSALSKPATSVLSLAGGSVFWVGHGDGTVTEVNGATGEALRAFDVTKTVDGGIPFRRDVDKKVKIVQPVDDGKKKEEEPAKTEDKKEGETKPAKPAEESKPAEEKSAEATKPAEEKPSEAAKPVDEAKPAEEKPAEAKPAEEKPAEEKPAEAAKPAEEKPAEAAKPAEASKPAEEAKPAEGEKKADAAEKKEEEPKVGVTSLVDLSEDTVAVGLSDGRIRLVNTITLLSTEGYTPVEDRKEGKAGSIVAMMIVTAGSAHWVISLEDNGVISKCAVEPITTTVVAEEETKKPATTTTVPEEPICKVKLTFAVSRALNMKVTACAARPESTGKRSIVYLLDEKGNVYDVDFEDLGKKAIAKTEVPPPPKKKENEQQQQQGQESDRASERSNKDPNAATTKPSGEAADGAEKKEGEEKKEEEEQPDFARSLAVTSNGVAAVCHATVFMLDFSGNIVAQFQPLGEEAKMQFATVEARSQMLWIQCGATGKLCSIDLTPEANFAVRTIAETNPPKEEEKPKEEGQPAEGGAQTQPKAAESSEPAPAEGTPASTEEKKTAEGAKPAEGEAKPAAAETKEGEEKKKEEEKPPGCQVSGGIIYPQVDAERLWTLASNGMNIAWMTEYRKGECEAIDSAEALRVAVEQQRQQLDTLDDDIALFTKRVSKVRTCSATALAAGEFKSVASIYLHIWMKFRVRRQHQKKRPLMAALLERKSENITRAPFFDQMLRLRNIRRMQKQQQSATEFLVRDNELVCLRRFFQLLQLNLLQKRAAARRIRCLETLTRNIEIAKVRRMYHRWQRLRARRNMAKKRAELAVVLQQRTQASTGLAAFLQWNRFARMQVAKRLLIAAMEGMCRQKNHLLLTRAYKQFQGLVRRAKLRRLVATWAPVMLNKVQTAARRTLFATWEMFRFAQIEKKNKALEEQKQNEADVLEARYLELKPRIDRQEELKQRKALLEQLKKKQEELKEENDKRKQRVLRAAEEEKTQRAVPEDVHPFVAAASWAATDCVSAIHDGEVLVKASDSNVAAVSEWLVALKGAFAPFVKKPEDKKDKDKKASKKADKKDEGAAPAAAAPAGDKPAEEQPAPKPEDTIFNRSSWGVPLAASDIDSVTQDMKADVRKDVVKNFKLSACMGAGLTNQSASTIPLAAEAAENFSHLATLIDYWNRHPPVAPTKKSASKSPSRKSASSKSPSRGRGKSPAATTAAPEEEEKKAQPTSSNEDVKSPAAKRSTSKTASTKPAGSSAAAPAAKSATPRATSKPAGAKPAATSSKAAAPKESSPGPKSSTAAADPQAAPKKSSPPRRPVLTKAPAAKPATKPAAKASSTAAKA